MLKIIVTRLGEVSQHGGSDIKKKGVNTTHTKSAENSDFIRLFTSL